MVAAEEGAGVVDVEADSLAARTSKPPVAIDTSPLPRREAGEEEGITGWCSILEMDVLVRRRRGGSVRGQDHRRGVNEKETVGGTGIEEGGDGRGRESMIEGDDRKQLQPIIREAICACLGPENPFAFQVVCARVCDWLVRVSARVFCSWSLGVHARTRET